MKFLSAGIANQVILEVKVKNEIIVPTSNIKGRLILDGALLNELDIPVDEATTYFVDISSINVSKGQVKNLRVLAYAPTSIGMYNYNSVYSIIDYTDIPIDYDTIRNKLGILENEVYDYELNLETTYLDSFKVFTPQLAINII